MSQVALLNAGANIEVFGSAVPSSHKDLLIVGDFENQTDVSANDGSIDLVDNANIFVRGSWTNNSFSNVFVSSSTSLIDGVVVFDNDNINQVIGGLSPTFFENLNLVGSRKILSNTDNSVNNALLLDAALDLNGKMFEIKNSNSFAISYKSGFIKSESLPGNIGYLKWNTANKVGTYSVPFGSDNQMQMADLRLEIDIKSSMSASDYFKFATYHSDMYNLPLPDGASSLESNIRKVADRFWLIEPSDMVNLPILDIIFTYTSSDISKSYNSIDPKLLVASRYNSTLGKWLDMTPRGDSYLNKVEIKHVSPSEFFPVWTLLNNPPVLDDLFMPTAFSPNGDGLNDEFFPVFQIDYEIIEYEFFIFNRWGRTVFYTNDQTIGWDGSIAGSSSKPIGGVYSWIVVVKGRQFKDVDARGVKKKYTGKVTLFL